MLMKDTQRTGCARYDSCARSHKLLLGDAVYLEGGEGGAAIWQHLVAEVEGRKLGTLGTMEGKETVLLGPMV